MKEKQSYLKLIPVTPQVYEQLQELWQYELFDYLDHSPQQAANAAKKLRLSAAVDWISTHPEDYAFGQHHGQWRLAGEFNGNVICHRFNDGSYGPSALTNVPRSVVHHSPCGHEWGFGGSGPSDLALDILNWFVPPSSENGRVECWVGVASKKAWDWHHLFKRDVIAPLPREGGTLSVDQIWSWIAYAENALEELSNG